MTTPREHPAHGYEARILWDGNLGDGTADYRTYGRQYRVEISGKPDIVGSADVAFRGEAGRHNPEDLFLAAISACHMLSYLALCAKFDVVVLAYEDRARGTMREDGRGGGRFTEVELHPIVTISEASDAGRARSLHGRAHEQCYIAASCNVPIRHSPEVRK